MAGRTAVAGLVTLVTSIGWGFPAAGAPASGPTVHAQIERGIQHGSKGSRLVLELAGGLVVSGEFYGFVGDWDDPNEAATRYEAWWALHPAGVPRLDEPVRLALASGDTLRGRFKGVGPTFVALETSSSRYDEPVSFDAIGAMTGEAGVPFAAWSDLQPRLLDAPSVVGVALKWGDEVMFVPRASIVSVRRESKGDVPVVAILIGVGAVIGLAVLACNEMNKDIDNTISSCGSASKSSSVDRRFGSSDLSKGLEAWAPGETRRP